MLYWNEIINDLAKILTKYERISGKKIIFPPRYYANCVSTTLTISILHNIESVYFFYNNPVHIWDSLQCLWLWRNESAVSTDFLFTRPCRKFKMKWQYTERSHTYRKETVLVQKIRGELLKVQPSRIKKNSGKREKTVDWVFWPEDA
jgi:hypothetical protein